VLRQTLNAKLLARGKLLDIETLELVLDPSVFEGGVQEELDYDNIAALEGGQQFGRIELPATRLVENEHEIVVRMPRRAEEAHHIVWFFRKVLEGERDAMPPEN
jgi:hypothetical protein